MDQAENFNHKCRHYRLDHDKTNSSPKNQKGFREGKKQTKELKHTAGVLTG
ncbi:hypothetical protein [Polycladidibacter stylochi]|uniref:hypothetical protein n=1 Tax=Polycladidibacter stylochi TaxID=1807766 RepID=UPI0019D3539A|nr:hypothetical protein [Pseudovibrio stylochi]